MASEEFDEKSEEKINLAIGIISVIRNIRAEVNIPPQKLCKAIVAAGSGKNRAAIEESLEYIKNLAKLESLELAEKLKRPKASSTAVFGDCEICVPLEGLVDIEAERKKMMSKAGELEKYTKSIEAKLKNENFAQRAPKEIIDKEREKLAEAGIALAYHNHNFEFAKTGGKTWLELIYDNTDPKNLQAEIDTYWVQAGGGDPAEWIRKYAGRLSVLHAKDMVIGPDNEQRFAEIGEGNLNWPAILSAADDAGVEWYCVEEDDCYGRDPFESLKISLENLRGMGLK